MFGKIKNTELEFTPKTSIKPYKLPEGEGLEKYRKISLSSIGALGVGFDALKQGLNAIATAKGKSGLYYVDVLAKDGTLARKHGGKSFIGTVIKKGKGILNQSELSNISFDPTMICMAMVLVSVEKKMESIEETQEKILAFLEKKERTSLEANLSILTEILKNYKYNWGNSMYKNSKYQQIQEIKRDAEKDVKFYRVRIEDELKKSMFMHTDKNVEDKIKGLCSDYNDYQFSLYLYAFAYFLEVMFLENFQKDYIESVLEDMQKHCSEYTQLYNQVYDMIEGYSKTSLENNAVKALSGISKGAGNLFAKIPVVNKTKLNENLILVGESLLCKQRERVGRVMDGLFSGEIECISPFIENVKLLQYTNDKLEFFVDNENIYLK